MITVLLADDHAVVRDGLRALLEAQGDMVVVGATGDGREVLSLVQRLGPEVVILDIIMPGVNGIENAQRLSRELPSLEGGPRVIILSMHSGLEFITAALKAGVQGYLAKESAGSELVHAIRAVHSGRRYFSHTVTELMARHLADDNLEASGSELAALSGRERQVLQLVAEGKSSAAIAEQLFLSSKTIDTYRSRLMRKLGLNNRSELVRFAIQRGLITIS